MAWKFKVFAITNSLDFKDYTQKQAFGVGRRTGMTDGSGSAAWSYDKRGRMSQENKIVGTSDKFTTQWAYNAADKLISMSYPMKDLGQVDDPGKERLDSAAHICIPPPDGAQVRLQQCLRLLLCTVQHLRR
jgi:YD repeat-containing protein